MYSTRTYFPSTFLALAVILLIVPAAAFGDAIVPTGPVSTELLNGHPESQTDAYNYFYRITGGLFPTGNTPNGSAASGGTFRILADDPYWTTTYSIPLDTWYKDGWYTDNAGFALTLRDAGGNIVYDNNGIETGTYGDYYNENGQHGDHGLYRGYGMSNDYDLVYASYFKIETAVTVQSITGYFDGNGAADTFPAFNPYNPDIAYRTNIWSDAGNLLPTNTGSFVGDVLSSDLTYGVSTVGNTGVVRVFTDLTTDPIFRLTFTLGTPITLQPGTYWFSQDAVIEIPEPGTMLLLASGLAAAFARRK